MIKPLHFFTSLLSIISLGLFSSCDKKQDPKDYSAYFGGEVLNPNTNYVLFMKGNDVIDTIFLDKQNRFLHKFDSLSPGLYSFIHHPEYQNVYFDKNDSLMVIINSKDFDNSIVFCGRGDAKNNYLMEMFLANEKDKSSMYDVFFRNSKDFIKNIDSSYKIRKNIYTKNKEKFQWNESFDSIALNTLNLHHFNKKEIYPYAHKFITGNNIINNLPANYYNHRKEVDFNNPTFSNYHPFIKYVTAVLNNKAFTEKKGNIDEYNLENSLLKLKIADTLIKNEKIKNAILNRLAFNYILEEKNSKNNKNYIDKYLSLSTDVKMKSEIKSIYNNINKLTEGTLIPKESFINEQGIPVDLSKIIKRQTVIFFYSTKAESHLVGVHKKVKDYKLKYPNVDFIAINIDDSTEEWKKKLSEFEHKDIVEIHAVNFEKLKEDWVIYSNHRTMILNPDGTIKNAFVHLFDVNFEENLK
jgi:peroxiredoxin